MIHVCIPSHDEAQTVGLLLWKIRQVFTDFPREYQLLVANDGSSDSTADVLAPYARVLPLTIVTHPQRLGYAASVEELLRMALERSDRPKRDCAVVMHADFTHDAAVLPDIVRRLESGADLVVAEGQLNGEQSRARRWLRRLAPVLLGRRVRVPGVRDVVSGYAAFRLIVLRHAMRERPGPLLHTEGWAARAELLALAARHARQIESLRAPERHDRRPRPSRIAPVEAARDLWKARRELGGAALPESRAQPAQPA
jgi:glycosyltransferase involved in cell wall biosynthesis